MKKRNRLICIISYLIATVLICKINSYAETKSQPEQTSQVQLEQKSQAQPEQKSQAQPEQTSQNQTVLELPDMTADEHFMIFGSNGDESYYTYDEIVDSLDRIRNLEDCVMTYEESAQEDSLELLGAAITSMTTSQSGITFIKRHEGLKLTAYKALSTEKYYTIGYGHNGSDVYEGMTITEAQAEQYLVNDVKTFENSLNTYCIKYNIHLNQNQFDALISFSYNVGTGWQSKIDMPKMLKNGQERFSEDIVYEYFGQWRKSGGQVVQGLVNRRKDEAALFLTPCYDMCMVNRVSLDLTGHVGENLYLALTNEIARDSNAFVRVLYRDQVVQYKITDILTNANGNDARLQINLPIRYATDTVTAYIYKGDGGVVDIRNANTADDKGYHFSLDEYRALASLESSNTLLIKLIDVLKEYSVCANKYFEVKDTSSYIEPGMSLASLEKYKRVLTGKVDGLSYMGTSLILEGDLQIRYYFELESGYNADDYTFYIFDTPIDKTVNGNLVYVTIGNLAALNIDDTFPVKVTNNRGQTLTLVGGAYTYAYSVYEHDKTDLKGLMGAMYRYNKAAEAYFGE